MKAFFLLSLGLLLTWSNSSNAQSVFPKIAGPVIEEKNIVLPNCTYSLTIDDHELAEPSLSQDIVSILSQRNLKNVDSAPTEKCDAQGICTSGYGTSGDAWVDIELESALFGTVYIRVTRSFYGPNGGTPLKSYLYYWNTGTTWSRKDSINRVVREFVSEIGVCQIGN